MFLNAWAPARLQTRSLGCSVARGALQGYGCISLPGPRHTPAEHSFTLAAGKPWRQAHQTI